MISVVFNTLNPVLGDDAVAHDSGGWNPGSVSGITEDGMAEMHYSGAYKLGPFDGGGSAPWGASRYGDGLSSQDPGNMEPPPENDEVVSNAGQVPLSAVTISYGYMPDTGGPGKFRGGVGTYMDVKWLVPTTQSSANPRTRRPPPGVNGGQPGRLGAGWVWDSDEVEISADHPLPVTLHDPIYKLGIPVLGVLDPETHEVDPLGKYYDTESSVAVPPGSVIRIVSHGAGGWVIHSHVTQSWCCETFVMATSRWPEPLLTMALSYGVTLNRIPKDSILTPRPPPTRADGQTVPFPALSDAVA